MEFFQSSPIDYHRSSSRQRNRWRREGGGAVDADDANTTRKSVTTESAWLMPGLLRVFSVYVLYEVMEVHELLDSPARISLGIFATSFLLDSLVSFAYTLFPSRYSAYMWSWPWPFSRMMQPQGRAYTSLDDEESKMTGAQIALTLFHALLSYLSLRLWCQGLIALSPPLAIAVDALSNALIACLICTGIRMDASMAGLLRTILPAAVLLMSLGFISSAQIPAPLPCTFTTLASCAVDASSRLLLAWLSPSASLHQRLSRLSVLFAAIFAAVAAGLQAELTLYGGGSSGRSANYRREDAFITDIHELERDGINEELSHKPVIAFVQMAVSITFVSIFGSHLSRNGSTSTSTSTSASTSTNTNSGGGNSSNSGGNSEDKPRSWADQGLSVATGWRAMTTSTITTLSLWMLQRNIDSAYLATASTSNSVDIPLLQGFLYPYLPLSKVITVVAVAHVAAWWGHRCADTALERKSTTDETSKEAYDSKAKNFGEAVKVVTIGVKGCAIAGNLGVSVLTNSFAHTARACLLVHEMFDSGKQGGWIPLTWKQRRQDIIRFFRAGMSAVLIAQSLILCLQRMFEPPHIRHSSVLLPMAVLTLVSDALEHLVSTSQSLPSSPKAGKKSGNVRNTTAPLVARNASGTPIMDKNRQSAFPHRSTSRRAARALALLPVTSSVCLCISSAMVLSYPAAGTFVDLGTTAILAAFLIWLTKIDIHMSTPLVLLRRRRADAGGGISTGSLQGGNASWFSWPHDHEKSYGHLHYTCEESHELPEDVKQALLSSQVDFAVQVDVSQKQKQQQQ